MKFCAACSKVLGAINENTTDADNDKRLNPNGLLGIRHHRSQQDFLEAVDAGCPFCQSLWADAIQRRVSPGGLNVEVDEVLNGLLQGYEESSTRVHLRPTTISLQYRDIDNLVLATAKFDVLPSRNLVWEGGERSPTTTSCRGNLESQNVAGHWLDQCLRHTPCGNAQQVYRPRRLVEILDLASPSSRVRLVHSAFLTDAPQYATLSYCWGDVPAMDLTRARLTEFERGVDAGLLPLTYQHAFAVCAALSIRYLWIDSLCIIQDDAQDWLSEAQQMSEIFKNSHLTIAADASTNRQGGLFIERTASGIPRITITLSPATHGLSSNREYDFIDQRVFTIMPDQPLNRRGWVFQERILSRRILHFTTHGLMWECRSHLATQVFQQGIPNLNRIDNVRDLDVFRSREGGAAHGCLSPARHDAWADLVRFYTSAALTYPDDRPLAIKGIADEISRLSGMQYVSGLWTDNLIAQLMWYDESEAWYEPHRASRNTSRRSMPSFSWLSVDGPVAIRASSPSETTMSEVINVQCGPLETTPNGLVQQACLTIRTILRRLNFMSKPMSRPNRIGGSWVDWQIQEFPVSHSAWMLTLDYSRPQFCLPSTLPVEYSVILLMRRTFEDNNTIWYGLILEPQDSQKKQFHRLGCFMFTERISPEEFERWMASSTEETVIELI